MKIVINIGDTQFRLSDKQIEYYAILKGSTLTRDIKDVSLSDLPTKYLQESFLWYHINYKLDGQPFDYTAIPRNDPTLISVVEKINNGTLKILEIPDDVDFVIENCGGVEWVAEKHRSWGKT